MKILTTITATTVGGRDGHGTTSDGNVDIQFAQLKELGGAARKVQLRNISSASATRPVLAARCSLSRTRESLSSIRTLALRRMFRWARETTAGLRLKSG